MIENILKILNDKYHSLLITKPQLAEIMNCSLSTIDNLLKEGKNIPKPIKFGEGKNSSIRFNIADVAEFLSTGNRDRSEVSNGK